MSGRDQRDFDAELAAARLGRALDPSRPLPAPPDSGGRAVAVVGLLGERLGFTPRPVTVDDTASPLEQARRIVEGSAVRVREVTLDDGWWRDNVPPMLVEHAGSVALVLPGPMFRPRLWRPERDPVPVTAAVAAEISPRGYEVTRPLPAGSSGLRELLRVSLTGTRRDMAYAVVMALLLGLVSLAVPVATSVIFSDIVPTGDRGRLLLIALILVSLSITAAMFTYTRAYQMIRLSDAVEMGSSGAILDRLLRVPASHLRAWPSAELASRVLVSGSIATAMDQAVSVGLMSLALVLLNGTLMVVLSPPLGAIALVAGAAIIVVSYSLSRAEGRRVLTELNDRSHVEDVSLDILRGWVPVRLSDGDVSAFGRWAAAYGRYRSAFNARWNLEIASDLVRTAIIGLALALVVIVAYALPTGTIDSATFLAFVSAYGIFTAGLAGIAESLRAAVRTIPEIDRVAPLLALETESGQQREDPGTLSGRIDVRRVSFRYADDLPWILRDITFTVPAGSSVAIVGTSGSGKSTLLRLLLGFEAPRSGTILYDEADLDALDLTLLRRQFGVVLQSSLLLPGTLRDNLTISSGPLPEARLWELLEQVSLAEWVSALPLGLDTTVDEGSTVLSGGQRQRLLLARAIAGNPVVLFLDEATSALDNITQAAVTATISSLGMTRVVIAHRLSTVRDVEQIIVLDQGRIAESGDYASLMAADGIFAELVRRQEL
jgi:ATP-binding cassette subfamily C protein